MSFPDSSANTPLTQKPWICPTAFLKYNLHTWAHNTLCNSDTGSLPSILANRSQDASACCCPCSCRPILNCLSSLSVFWVFPETLRGPSQVPHLLGSLSVCSSQSDSGHFFMPLARSFSSPRSIWQVLLCTYLVIVCLSSLPLSDSFCLAGGMRGAGERAGPNSVPKSEKGT